MIGQNSFAADLTSILKKYSGNTKLTVEYDTFSTTLNESQLQKGEIYLRPGKFNWTFTDPASKLILYNGKVITYVEKEGNSNFVTNRKGVSPKQLVWFQLFSSPGKVKVVNHDKKTNTYKVKLDQYTLEIKVNKDLVQSFTYFDELDSRITLTVKDVKFKDDSKVEFSYTPTKSDQVTDL